MEKLKFFANQVRHRELTIHMLNGAGAICLSGVNRIPATEEDMNREGKVEIIMEQPYRIHVCGLCQRRYRLYEESYG